MCFVDVADRHVGESELLWRRESLDIATIVDTSGDPSGETTRSSSNSSSVYTSILECTTHQRDNAKDRTGKRSTSEQTTVDQWSRFVTARKSWHAWKKRRNSQHKWWIKVLKCNYPMNCWILMFTSSIKIILMWGIDRRILRAIKRFLSFCLDRRGCLEYLDWETTRRSDQNRLIRIISEQKRVEWERWIHPESNSKDVRLSSSTVATGEIPRPSNQCVEQLLRIILRHLAPWFV